MNDDDVTKAGWWLASDGQWYPPETKPAPSAVPTPAPAPAPEVDPVATAPSASVTSAVIPANVVMGGLAAVVVVVLVVLGIGLLTGGAGGGGGQAMATTDAGTDVKAVYDAFQASDRIPELDAEYTYHFSGCYPCEGTFETANVLVAGVTGSTDEVKISVLRSADIADDLRDSHSAVRGGFSATCGPILITVEGQSDFDGKVRSVHDVLRSLEGSC